MVDQIAQRAGLTKRTLFRHFADKRETLFGGQDALARLFAEGIAEAPEDADPAEMLDSALRAVARILDAQRWELARRRAPIIAANEPLRERELYKRVALRAVLGDALRERGIPKLAASLHATLGVLAFSTAFARWLEPDHHEGFDQIASQTLTEILTSAAALGKRR